MKKLTLIFSAFMAVFLLFGCTQHSGEKANADLVAQLKTLPANTVAVGYTNFNKLRNATVIKNFIETKQNDILRQKTTDSLRKYLGIDPLEDISAVLIAAVPTGSPEKISGFAMVTGHFDVQRIEEFLSSDSLKDKMIKQSYAGHSLYLVKDKHHHPVFVLNPQKVIFGEEAVVKKWLDEKKGNHSMPVILQKQFTEISWPNDAWFIVNGANMNKFIGEFKNSKMDKRAVKGMKNFSSGIINVGMNDKFQFSGTADFSSQETAELVKDMLKGFIATAKLSVSEQRELVDIVNQLNVTQKGNRVQMHGVFTEEQLKKLQTIKMNKMSRSI